MDDSPKPWYRSKKIFEIFPSFFAGQAKNKSAAKILAGRGPDAESLEATCAQCGARYPNISNLTECAECGSDNLVGATFDNH
jgi:hypothetical protein